MPAWNRGGEMPSIEERVAYLEGKTEDHTLAIGDLRNDVRDLRAEMISRFEHVDGRFEQIDRRFEQIDRRFEQIDRRFEQMDGRLAHMDNRFNWSVGLQFATLLAVVSAVLAAFYR
jgi:chromosome segregation ATPase